jgi:hypothetical protein
VTTTATSFIIEGSGEPDMTIDIMKAAAVVGSATAIPDGTFAIEVPLSAGDNMFTVREMNSCTSKEATVPVIHRTVVEQPPSDQAEAPSPTTISPPVSIPLPPLATKPSVKEPSKTTSGFLQPIITGPINGTVLDSGHVWVKGRAKAGSLVTIYVNSQSVARVIADQSGNYGALVELDEGRNTLQVRSELNGRSSLSDIVEVTYIPERKPVSDDGSNLLVRAIEATTVTVSSIAVVVGGKWAVTKLGIRWFKK